jgi:hypothetical protein
VAAMFVNGDGIDAVANEIDVVLIFFDLVMKIQDFV